MLALALFFSSCVTTQTQVRPSKAVFLELYKTWQKVFVSAKSWGCAYELGSLISSQAMGAMTDSSANAGKANR